eukprot:scaffold287116_cov60-Attheya_sp.AAC.1
MHNPAAAAAAVRPTFVRQCVVLADWNVRGVWKIQENCNCNCNNNNNNNNNNVYDCVSPDGRQ